MLRVYAMQGFAVTTPHKNGIAVLIGRLELQSRRFDVFDATLVFEDLQIGPEGLLEFLDRHNAALRVIDCKFCALVFLFAHLGSVGLPIPILPLWPLIFS